MKEISRFSHQRTSQNLNIPEKRFAAKNLVEYTTVQEIQESKTNKRSRLAWTWAGSHRLPFVEPKTEVAKFG